MYKINHATSVLKNTLVDIVFAVFKNELERNSRLHV